MSRKLDSETVQTLKNMYENGYSITEITKRLGVSDATVRRYVKKDGDVLEKRSAPETVQHMVPDYMIDIKPRAVTEVGVYQGIQFMLDFEKKDYEVDYTVSKDLKQFEKDAKALVGIAMYIKKRMSENDK